MDDDGEEGTKPALFRCVATSAAVRDLLARVRAKLNAKHVAETDVQVLCIVLAELCNNVIEHGKRQDQAGEVKLMVSARTATLCCEFRDNGVSPPAHLLHAAAMPSFDTARPEDWPEGGFGWPLVHKLALRLRYARVDGENILRFQIARQPPNRIRPE